jgi:tRNA (guanosine-2'-O-)-methyltransferase
VRRDSPDVTEAGARLGFPFEPEWTAEQVIAALEPLVGARRRDRISTVVSQRLESVTLVMDAPHDPHNGAAIIRSCDAFGVQSAHVVERRERFVVARRIAKGTQHWVDIVRHNTVEGALSSLVSQGYELVMSHPRGRLLPEDLGRVERLALVIGNEHDGICEALERAATHSVRVPMRGFVESLNVSVSAAVLLQAATRGRRGDLSPDAARRLYARGLFQSVPRAAEVLHASMVRSARSEVPESIADDRPPRLY